MKAPTFSPILDYNYDLSRQRVWLVSNGSCVLGILEKLCGVWKAYSGSGFSCRYLSEHRSKQAAVEAIERAEAILE